MSELDLPPRYQGSGGRGVVRAVALPFVLLLVAGLCLGAAPIPDRPQILGTPTSTPTPNPTPTATVTPSPTPTATPSPTPTATPTATAPPTPSPTASPSPTPAAPAAHLWLAAPIGPDSSGDRLPGTYFPYGATGSGRYHQHHGVDYMNPEGTPVLAVAAGRVLFAGNDEKTVTGLEPGFYGNLVIQELDRRFQDQPVYVLYGHLFEASVQTGQYLEEGNQVGLVGMTGIAIGHHLHLEVRLGKNDYESTRNPVLWLRPELGEGVIAGLFVDAAGKPVVEVPITFFRAAEPSKWWRQTLTYGDWTTHPDGARLRSDDQLGENFALGYVPAGEYLAKGEFGGKSYVRPVKVEQGEVSFVLIAAEE